MRFQTLALPRFLALFMAAGLTFATFGVARADGDKCTLVTKLKDSPTADACKRGGRKEAAKVMKQMVKTAKLKGVKFTCDDCHKDNESYELNKNAEADYEKLLAAQK